MRKRRNIEDLICKSLTEILKRLFPLAGKMKSVFFKSLENGLIGLAMMKIFGL
tara:strand:- start:174 stop:332 length:159 start_codon:yes stop_codon:yes gene_type:complete